MSPLSLPAEIEFHAAFDQRYSSILTPEALDFLVTLQREFNPRRKQLLAARVARQQAIDAGARPDFLPETAHIRSAQWSIVPLPSDLQDRRVEITGPVDRKMIINALNSGAKVFMADFEDSTTPTWGNLLDGHLNLRDAIRRTITYSDPTTNKQYALIENPAVLFVRARGWHLEERHVLVDGEPMSGSLFDFGLYLFHNAKELLARGSGPYFYLPKLESHIEARLWNDVFVRAQQLIGIPNGSIRATVLIETILATFEMDEILYELRDHSAGLNCGRWDYIFSVIKKFSASQNLLFPDRSQITMTTPFMRAYSKLTIKTCHHRNAPAIGGMSAFIPIKSDPVANETAIAQVRADKEREATDGHDGTWVAHPGLVPIALEVFNRVMPQPNQIAKQLPGYSTTAAELLAPPIGTITYNGLKHNIAVGLGYLEAWMRGTGCVPLFNLMEDAATAEISRAQLWQWVHHHAVLQDADHTGQHVTEKLCHELIDAEVERNTQGASPGRIKAYHLAAKLIRNLIDAPAFQEFLTLPAYTTILHEEGYTA
ncbi:MAG: malate synthase A [Acidobacteriaceae bacterium]